MKKYTMVYYTDGENNPLLEHRVFDSEQTAIDFLEKYHYSRLSDGDDKTWILRPSLSDLDVRENWCFATLKEVSEVPVTADLAV